jgi:hypothetical protein
VKNAMSQDQRQSDYQKQLKQGRDLIENLGPQPARAAWIDPVKSNFEPLLRQSLETDPLQRLAIAHYNSTWQYDSEIQHSRKMRGA